MIADVTESTASPKIVPIEVTRLWQAARFLPNTVRLLGTRYRPLFLAYAKKKHPEGRRPVVADAFGFLDFMSRQNSLALLDPEETALSRDANVLRRKFRLQKKGETVKVVEKWKILQWLRL